MELRQIHDRLMAELRQLGARPTTVSQFQYQSHDEIEDKIEQLQREVRQRGGDC